MGSTTNSVETSLGSSFNWAQTDTVSQSQTYSDSKTSSLSVTVKVAADQITYTSVTQGDAVLPAYTKYDVRLRLRCLRASCACAALAIHVSLAGAGGVCCAWPVFVCVALGRGLRVTTRPNNTPKKTQTQAPLATTFKACREFDSAGACITYYYPNATSAYTDTLIGAGTSQTSVIM